MAESRSGVFSRADGPVGFGSGLLEAAHRQFTDKSGPFRSGLSRGSRHALVKSPADLARLNIPLERPKGSLPTRPAEALGLRVALEHPTAIQADQVANAVRPGIGGAMGSLICQMCHLSVAQDVVPAEQDRPRANGARRG
jgi:hypothetical protein